MAKFPDPPMETCPASAVVSPLPCLNSFNLTKSESKETDISSPLSMSLLVELKIKLFSFSKAGAMALASIPVEQWAFACLQ